VNPRAASPNLISSFGNARGGANMHAGKSRWRSEFFLRILASMFPDTRSTKMGIRISEVTARSAVQILTEKLGADRVLILRRGQPAPAVSTRRLGGNSTTKFIDRCLFEGATPAAMAQYARPPIGTGRGL